MTLFYIDKDSDDRLMPKPNSQDVNQAPKAKSTDSIVHRAESHVTVTGKVTIKDDQIIVNDGTNDRILIGFQEGGF